MRPNRGVPLLFLCALFAIAVSSTSCFAFPQYEQTIPAEAFVAANGGDVGALPDNCPPITTKSVWYDREVSFSMNGTKRDGSPYSLDFTSASNGSNALEARRSDNDRSMANLAGALGFLNHLASLAAATQGVPLPAGSAVPAPPDARLAAIEARLEAITAALESIKPKAPDARSPEVELPPDGGSPAPAGTVPNGAGPPEG